ncbi:MAG: hypothetical protein GTO02_22685, partial [Candidatus Dadabacteria bacterium]|nr:hypothetical protein [Candidatus Dadabacteria bacterium]
MKITAFLSSRCLLFVSMAFFTPFVLADSCPSIKDITYRLISKDYEWTVDEGVTLNNLLSVEQLIAVSIENNGEFVSCKYKYKEKFLKL